jgi:hypothetical protein
LEAYARCVCMCMWLCGGTSQEEKAFHEMMTPLEARRRKYMEKKKGVTGRCVCVCALIWSRLRACAVYQGTGPRPYPHRVVRWVKARGAHAGSHVRACREDDTLKRLSQFRSGLLSKASSKGKDEEEEEAPPKEAESYHGQVMEQDILEGSDDDDDGDWFKGKLVRTVCVLCLLVCVCVCACAVL